MIVTGTISGQLSDGKAIIPVQISANENEDYQNVTGLVDTGATHTVIPTRLMNSLNLKDHVMVESTAVGIKSKKQSYLSKLKFIFGTPHGRNMEHAIANSVTVVEDVMPEFADIIIGMDVLSNFDMSFHSDGNFRIRKTARVIGFTQ